MNLTCLETKKKRKTVDRQPDAEQAAPPPKKRTNRRHGEIIKLAAEIAGVSLSMVYKVRNGDATSASVDRAMDLAKEQMRRKKRKVAA